MWSSARMVTWPTPRDRQVLRLASRVPAVASYETILTIPLGVEDAFAFVSDFRNAPMWDPRTYAVEKTTEGPIGVGTRFMLTGGLMPARLVRRLHIPTSLAGMALPYDVVEYDAPTIFVLTGESRLVRYRDRLEFVAQGDSTQLRYFAELELKGPLAAGDPLLQRVFTRIGDDATRRIPDVVGRGA